MNARKPQRRRRLRMAAALVVAAATAVLVGACGEDGEGGGEDGEPIVIGAAVAESGIMSQFDEPVVQGAEVAIDEINADGGVDGRELELTISDHQSDLDQVERSALEVMDEGADVVITTHDFDFGSPAAIAANSEGILSLGGAGGMSYGFDGLGPLHFNLYPGNVTEGAVMAQFASDQGYERPYLMQDLSIEYTREVCEYFTESWTDIAGSEPVGQSTFQNDDQSFSSQVNDVRGTDADAVVLCSYPPGGPGLIRQLRAANVDLPIVASGGGMDGVRWLDAVPNLSDYYDVVMASLTGDDPDPARNELFAEIESRHGSVPQLAAQALTGYSAIQAIARAVEANDGSTDGEELAATFEEFEDEELIVGPVTYSEECHIPIGMPMQVRQVQGGESSYLDTVTPESLPDSPC